MKIRPLADRLVVRPITVDKTPGGILLADVAKKRHGRGMVLCAGPGRKDEDSYFPDPAKPIPRIPMDVKEGDTVLYGTYAGTEAELEVGGEKLVILTEGDVLAVLEPDGPEDDTGPKS